MKLDRCLRLQLNSNWSKDFNVKPETIKCFDINNSNIFLDLHLKAKEIKAKTKKWHLIKGFCTAKETTHKTKTQPTAWEKVFVNDLTDKRLVSNIHIQLLQIKIKKKKKKKEATCLKNGQRTRIYISPVNRHMKRCSSSLIIREMQIKTTMRYHCTWQNGHLKKACKWQMLERVWRAGSPPTLLVGM